MISDSYDVKPDSNIESPNEPLFGLENSEERLYKILSSLEESIPDTPSRKSRPRLRSSRTSAATSAVKLKRPGLPRLPNLDDTSQQREFKANEIPGRFDSQSDRDPESEHSSTENAVPLGYEPVQLTDEERKILGEFVDAPVVTFLMRQAHRTHPPQWQIMTDIFERDMKARHQLHHLVKALRTRIAKRTSDSKLPYIPRSGRTVHPPLEFERWGSKMQQRRLLNNSVLNCIQSLKTLSRKSKPGWIYVFESPNAPGHVKIGKTWRDPQQRMAEWEMCGVKLVEVEDSFRNAFDHYSVVESLIKADLQNERRKYKCYHAHHAPKGLVVHEEWYEIDKQAALKSVHRWRHWIISQGPFDDTRKLTPYWQWRVEKLPKFIDDVNWDTWTHPSRLDYLDFQLDQFGSGYYGQIKAHLGRKDFHFCSTGGMMMFILYALYGIVGAFWGFLALLIL